MLKILTVEKEVQYSLDMFTLMTKEVQWISEILTALMFMSEI